MKKKIIILVVVILSIILVAFTVILFTSVKKDLMIESNLTKEVTELNLLIENNDNSNINTRLNTITTSGDYVLVEKAAKNYLKDKEKLFKEMYEILDNSDNIENLLMIDNIKTDGKEFTNTISLINNTGSKLTKLRDEYQSLTSKEKIESYLTKKLREDDYYNDYYLNELMADMMNNQKNLDAINKYLATVSKLKDIFTFLRENKDNWNLENDKIMFSSETLYNYYEGLLTGISDDKINNM